MIEIFEIESKLNEETAKKFNLTAFASDRVFIAMQKQQQIGIGILRLDKGIVYINKILLENLPFNYFDLFARSILNVLIDFSPIRVRVYKDDYFLRFGFKEAGEYLEIMSNQIKLCNH